MNDLVRKMLMKKHGYGENFEQDAQGQYDEQLDRSNTGNLFSNLGDVIAGNKVGSNNKFFENQNALAKENTIGRIDQQKKDFATDYDINRKMSEDDRKDAQLKSDDDINSEGSKIVQALGAKMGLDPKLAKQLTVTKWKSSGPYFEKVYEVEQKKLDRQDARAEKQRVLSQKAQELSASQAKQSGLYKSGSLAETQYQTATGKKEDFDPTSSGQWIDNSSWAPNWMKNDKAIQTQSAKDSWIESFLRDASGAAIAPSERGAYAEIYFPEPGDPDEVVKNKAELRQQKMASAGEAAGVKAQAGLKKFDDKVKAPPINTGFDLNSLEEERKRRDQNKVSKL